MAQIVLENLSKRYRTGRQEIPAVVDVNLRIDSGELFFLLGPSGCGKTTLLRMIAGFVTPTAGRILFGERDVTRLPPERRDSAMVFQNYALWPHMSVAKNVGFGLSVRGMARAQRQQAVDEILSTVGLADRAGNKPMELSGGQQQRVALARALAVRPSCLLLDEPLSNLDAALRAQMRWTIRRIVKDSGTTGVYVTHDQSEAMAIADRIAIMRQGRIVQVGSGRELYERPIDTFVAGFLGEANFIDGVVRQVDGQTAVVETELGGIEGRPAVPVRVGQPIVCCIRPEALRIVRTGPAAAAASPASSTKPAGLNQFDGQLTDWAYLGESARFSVKLATGKVLSGSAMPAPKEAAAGVAVGVQIPAQDIMLTNKDSGDA